MNKVLIVFAMKEEFSPWEHRHDFHVVWVAGHPVCKTSFGATEVLVALTGAGARDASHLPALIDQTSPPLGIVCGVAGGLKPEWRPGDMLVAQRVSGPTGEEKLSSDPALVHLAVQCGAKPAPLLVSLPRIASTLAEKARWANLGDAADMESFTLMKQLHERGIPALALRAIVDPAEIAMPCDFQTALDARGQVQMARLLSQLAFRPRAWPKFLRFALLSCRATSHLAHFLDRFLERLDGQQTAWGCQERRPH